MEKNKGSSASELFENLASLFRRFMFRILSVGAIPDHLAFIMDGNRRYAKKENLEEGAGHEAGFSSLMSVLRYCYELGVTYVTVYAFSIDNFKRQPDEVQKLMDLILEKIEGLLKEESIVNQYGVRVYFIGSLKLLNEPVRAAAEKVMKATANNTKCVLLICIAYTSCDEIVNAVHASCRDKLEEIQLCNSHRICNHGIEIGDDSAGVNGARASYQDEMGESLSMNGSTDCSGLCKRVEQTQKRNGVWNEAQPLKASGSQNSLILAEASETTPGEHSIIKLVDIEKRMYMAVAPDPDIVIRSSGETRLSNFLLWQSSNCLLYSPDALWPEMGLWHVVWAVLNFQRNHSYLEKKKKQL